MPINGAGLRNFQQLDERQNDGLTVELLWERDSNQVAIKVRDDKRPNGDKNYWLEFVPSDQARDAFEHPFSYIN
jgi:hypothetical protein